MISITLIFWLFYQNLQEKFLITSVLPQIPLVIYLKPLTETIVNAAFLSWSALVAIKNLVFLLLVVASCSILADFFFRCKEKYAPQLFPINKESHCENFLRYQRLVKSDQSTVTILRSSGWNSLWNNRWFSIFPKWIIWFQYQLAENCSSLQSNKTHQLSCHL
jgi:hypothetical protein